MGLAAQSHCQWPDACELGLGDSVCGLLGASQGPSRVEPKAEGPLEGGAGGCWRPPTRCGHPGAGCAVLAQLWGLRMACQAAGTEGRPCPRHSAPGASPGHSPPNTHSPQAPWPPPGAQEPAPRPPRQLLSSPPLGRHPGLWVTGGVRRSLTPEHHGSDAETSPSNLAQLRSYIKKWGF